MGEMSEIKDSGQTGAFIPLARFAKSIEAEMARELLANNGIDAILQGAYFGGLEPLLMAGGFSEIQLLVPDYEFEHARELYEAFLGNGPHALWALPSLNDDEEVDV